MAEVGSKCQAKSDFSGNGPVSETARVKVGVGDEEEGMGNAIL